MKIGETEKYGLEIERITITISISERTFNHLDYLCFIEKINRNVFVDMAIMDHVMTWSDTNIDTYVTSYKRWLRLRKN